MSCRQSVELEHYYQASPEEVWKVATDWGCLEKAMKGLLVFYGLPEKQVEQGQVIQTEFSMFGILPKLPWTMEIVEYDPKAMVLLSHEYGGAVKQWDHRLTIGQDDKGTWLRDHIEIDAGKLTSLYVKWAGFMYRRRHVPRQALLSDISH